MKTYKKKIKRGMWLWKNLLFEIKNCFAMFFKYGLIGNIIRIDASSMCQLKCPVCLQNNEEKKERMEWLGRSYLKFKDFEKFIDSHPEFKNIELSNWGEIFLNPELKQIIKYAYLKNISLTAYNGVNLNTVSEDVIEWLVKYRFKGLSISIDGVTGNTYKIYRRGGNFDKVIENIRRINYYKQKYNTEFPKLRWDFIIFGHNEHELPIAGKMAKELNMQFKLKLNCERSYSPVKNKEYVRSKAGAASRQEYEAINKKLYYWACGQLWYSPQINWDGRLLGCCINKWIDFGNVFESGLKKCLKSEKYIYAKKMVLGKKKAREDIPCFYCPTYKKIQLLKNPPLKSKIKRIF